MPTSPFTIRRATPEDDNAIGALLSVPYHDDPQWLTDEIGSIRNTFVDYGDMTPGYLHWVAVSQNNDSTNQDRISERVIGVFEGTVRLFANGCETVRILFLEGVAVAPDYQRAGVASALVETATKWALENGICEIASDCEMDNHHGQAWHESMGFEKADVVINYVKKIATS